MERAKKTRCAVILCFNLTSEFSLNDFHGIHQIQWIMTKFKSGMITRDIGGSKGDVKDARPSLGGTKFFHFHVVFSKNNPTLGVGAPSKIPEFAIERYYLNSNKYIPNKSNGNYILLTTSGQLTVDMNHDE